MKIYDLKRGTLVKSLEDFDPKGANVKVGDLGVVFELSDHYKDGCGPMVRWVGGGACNIYAGIVEVVIRVKIKIE